jgi:uncharacterized protein (DUF2062 family)
LVFKRRKKLGVWAAIRAMVYPVGGFLRATRYVLHRMRRLPDPPARIARGIFAGFLIGFLPLPGLQFVVAVVLAWMIRGNIFAALLGTFNSNPVTTPIFGVVSIGLGHRILGHETPLTAEAVAVAFLDAGKDLWSNFIAIFGHGSLQLESLIQFWHTIYVPYFIGSLIIGLVGSLLVYYPTLLLVGAYQKVRVLKAGERLEKRRLLKYAAEKYRAARSASIMVRRGKRAASVSEVLSEKCSGDALPEAPLGAEASTPQKPSGAKPE